MPAPEPGRDVSATPGQERRRGSRKWAAIGVVVLLFGVVLLAALWRSGRLLRGTEGRVAFIVRQITAEERANSEGISRLRYSLPGPLAELFDRLFPRNWQGDYFYREELAKLGTNAVPFLIRIVENERSVGARRVCALTLGDLNAREAIPTLTRLLRVDRDADIRAAMAEGLGTLGDTNAAPVLVAAMKADLSPPVREVSARALGDMRAKWAAPELIASLSGETNLTAKVGMIEALKVFADARAVPVLVEHLTTKEREESDSEDNFSGHEMHSASSIRSEAAAALGEIAGEAATTALIARIGDESDSSVGEAICEALGRIRDPRALPVLLAQVKENGSFKEAAIEGLGLIGDAKAVPALLLVLDEPDEDLRTKAVEALGRMGESKSAARLKQILEADPDENVRAMACSALALLGDVTACDAIARALPALKENQEAALWALGHLGDSNAVPVLASHLNAASRESRFAAAYALAEIGGPEAIKALRGHLKDEDDFARHGKACAFALLGESGGLATVRKGLQAGNAWQRFGSAIALIRLKDVDIVEELKPLQSDLDPELRALFVELISGRVTAGLETLLHGEDEDFRHYAARAFAFFGGPNSLSALSDACADRNAEVREAARLSYGRIERDRAAAP